MQNKKSRVGFIRFGPAKGRQSVITDFNNMQPEVVFEVLQKPLIADRLLFAALICI
jgi:hypothetical protein